MDSGVTQEVNSILSDGRCDQNKVRDRRLLFWAATITRFVFEVCVLKQMGIVSSVCSFEL